YRATALVMLDTRKAKVTNTADVLNTPNTFDIAAVQTEIEVLRSSTLLGRVVDKLKLDSDPGFGEQKPSPLRPLMAQTKNGIVSFIGASSDSVQPKASAGENTPRARAIAALERNLSILPRNRSYVIGVAIDSVDPAKAKRIV